MVLLSRTNCHQEDTIYNIAKMNNMYNYFHGYPQGNYLKQVRVKHLLSNVGMHFAQYVETHDEVPCSVQ